MENTLEFNEYLNVLNEEQRAAVCHEGKSLLILAGAGSGKTRVITTKIAYLISQCGYSPSSILAVTFTKKAANEMKERAVLLDSRAQFSQIRTFHSFGAYFLRKYYDVAGLEKSFTVYDDDDMVTLLTSAVPSLVKKQASHYAHLISLAKDYCLLPEDSGLSQINEDPKFPEIYALYQKRLRDTGNVDFGDLILLPYLILKNNEYIRHEIHNRYRVIMVDEYQDSNVAQFKLLQELSGVNENSGTYVCVVGDDDQSIYKFRGAEVQNILNFQKQFPGTDLIRLETNYRSTAEILACADSVVKHNEGRLGKTLVSARGKGKKPTLVFLPNQDDETDFCCDLIQQAAENGVPYSDWAILYRTNAQSLGFETNFMHRKIPYAVVGALKFYEREEVKDAIAWISFVANPKDEVSFRRIVNKPVRGIGASSQDKIVESTIGKSILTSDIKLSKKAAEGFKTFCDLTKEFDEMIPYTGESNTADLAEDALEAQTKNDESKNDENKNSLTLSVFVEAVIKKSGLEELHKSQDEVSGTQKVSNLQELINSAVLYPCSREGLLDFLDHINLDRTLETEDDGEEKDRVTLITLHNTKGLEFPRVIITGMESGVFPREGKLMDEIEEERRIFYVGITRAKNELYFTSCEYRRLYGRTNLMAPSLFLKELDKKYLRILGNKPYSFMNDSQKSSAEENLDPLAKEYHVGAGIFHDDYGEGQIIKQHYSEDGELVITVSFFNSGIKKFLPKFQGKSLTVINV